MADLRFDGRCVRCGVLVGLGDLGAVVTVQSYGPGIPPAMITMGTMIACDRHAQGVLDDVALIERAQRAAGGRESGHSAPPAGDPLLVGLVDVE